jgi:protein-S-isoprenylcysteine O-methyltransferase Ste14
MTQRGAIVAQAIAQILIFVILPVLTLFGAAGRLNIAGFWCYVAVMAAGSALALAITDPDLTRERLRPGGQRVGLRFLPIILWLFVHWTIAGLDRGRLHISDSVPAALQVMGLLAFALAGLVFIWAMHVNPFFSSIPRVQSDRGHEAITSGPYRWVRHPGYTSALIASITSGVALGSWLSTFIAPLAIVAIVRRTIVEERLLKCGLPGYVDFAARIRYRLLPGFW